MATLILVQGFCFWFQSTRHCFKAENVETIIQRMALRVALWENVPKLTESVYSILNPFPVRFLRFYCCRYIFLECNAWRYLFVYGGLCSRKYNQIIHVKISAFCKKLHVLHSCIVQGTCNLVNFNFS